ncbi:MAG: hypothetical protein KC731_23190 [Myxococcales bacterium]|nr:hypothetical protein [Myxococcales bacterium]
MRQTTIICLMPLLALGCSAASPQPVAPSAALEEQARAPETEPAPAIVDEEAPPVEAEAPAEVAVVEQEEPRSLPTACAEGSEPCTPPTDFVQRLCKAQKLDVALALFQRGTPWTRAYVRQDMEAWYASARRSRPRQLKYAEEVLVVASRAPSGMVIGGGSYDVLRWDGSCVSLMAGELSFRAPSTPDVATIPWRHLEDPMASVLTKNRKIAFRNDKRREACKSDDEVRCEEAESFLSLTIADYVRGGGELPPPRRVP